MQGRGGSRAAAQHLASVITAWSLWITVDRGRTVLGWGWGCSVNMDPEGKTDHICGMWRYQSRGDQSTEENINVQGAMGRSGGRVDPKEEWGVATVNAAEQSVGRL